MKAYSEVEVMVLREKYERSLTDLENNFYSLASQIVVGTFPMFGNINCEHHPGMNETVEKKMES